MPNDTNIKSIMNLFKQEGLGSIKCFFILPLILTYSSHSRHITFVMKETFKNQIIFRYYLDTCY